CGDQSPYSCHVRSDRPCVSFFFFLLLLLPRRSTLFPYTTLFRSWSSRSSSGRWPITSTDPSSSPTFPWRCRRWPGGRRTPPPGRSEEHTSELQSRENLVCRLLLEKKKNRLTIYSATLRVSCRHHD